MTSICRTYGETPQPNKTAFLCRQSRSLGLGANSVHVRALAAHYVGMTAVQTSRHRKYKIDDPHDMHELTEIIRERARRKEWDPTMREEIVSDTLLWLANQYAKDNDYSITTPYLYRAMAGVTKSAIDMRNRGQVGIALKVSGTRKSAQSLFRHLCEQKEQDKGDSLTEREQRTIAEKIIAEWPDQQRKPPIDFWVRPHFAPADDILLVSQHDRVLEPDFGLVYQTMEAEETKENGNPKAKARELVWSAIAPSVPITRASEYQYGELRTILRMDPTAITSAARAYSRGRSHSAQWALFAPFFPTSKDQKKEIVRVLLVTPSLACELLTAAYSVATQQKEEPMPISAQAQKARESFRSPRDGTFGNQNKPARTRLELHREYSIKEDAEELATAIREYSWANSGRHATTGVDRHEFTEELQSHIMLFAVEEANRNNGKIRGDKIRLAMWNALSRVTSHERLKGSIYGEWDKINSTDLQARARFYEEERYLEEDLGRVLTSQERRNLADEIREVWDDKRHRPSKDFMGKLKIVSDTSSSEGLRNKSSVQNALGFKPSLSAEEEYANSQFAEPQSNSKDDAVQAWWNGSAGEVLVKNSISRQKAGNARRSVRESGQTILQICDDWEEARDTDATGALFVPFAGAVSDREKTNVIDALRSQPEKAEELWDKAVGASTRKYVKTKATTV